MSTSIAHELRPRILERRMRLEAASRSIPSEYVHDLLEEVDDALRRIDNGSFGLCDTCHDPIEPDRLERNPLIRFCLDHLTREQLKAHEQDLQLATTIQMALLPARALECAGWETHFRYQPASAVGGDYCEAVETGSGLFFAVGDVAGKGVAASLLMTHLNAIFRSLLSLDLELGDMVSRANRLFAESTPATHYATLAAGRATGEGVELCNAGHCRPLLVRQGKAESIEATGLPIGLFSEYRHTVRRIELEPGDTLALYTDGITEAQNAEGEMYGEERLTGALLAGAGAAPAAAMGRVLDDVARFRGAGPLDDDVTLMIVRRR